MGAKRGFSPRIFILSFVCLGFVAYAAELRIKDELGLNLVTTKGEWFGHLAAGSVVKIPDDQVLRDSKGVPDVDLTLKAWSSDIYYFKKYGSVVYYPVEIVSAAPGSSASIKSHIRGVVALDALARREGPDSLEFVTTARSEVARVPTAGQISVKRILDAPTNSATPPGVKTIDEVRAIAAQKAGAKPKTFSVQNCGISTSDFKKKVEASAARLRMPPELFEAMGSMETDVDCSKQGDYAKNPDDPKGPTRPRSIGAFQVQARHTSNPDCHEDAPKGLSTDAKKARWERCVKYLRDPGHNIIEAEHVIEKKVAALRKFFPQIDQYPYLKWRLLLSCYNGGQLWVEQAIERIRDINDERAKIGKPNAYDIYSYTDLMKVMLLPPRPNEKNRAPKFSAMNVGYVETAFAIAEGYGMQNDDFRKLGLASGESRAIDTTPAN